MSNFRLVKRDYLIFNEINRWRVITGKQICILASFPSLRTCDRRLKKLIEKGYITRQKIIYGIPSIYSLTHRAKILIGLPARTEKTRLEQISHDITVLNVAIYFHNVKGIPFQDIRTEKQLHSIDGFSNRKHRPDFIFYKDNKFFCVEVELSLKNKDRLEKNIKQDFMNYDFTYWVVTDKENKIAQIIEQNHTIYPTIEILELRKMKEEFEHG
uniref:hypothetical protein n=1 Tax=Candidatus Fimivicinus sp. TaxID=3056640 RepID=UPI003FEE4971